MSCTNKALEDEYNYRVVLKIGVIGAGSMGSLHSRVVATNPRTKLAWICDVNKSAAQVVADRYGCRNISEPEMDVDGIIVAVSTQFHFDIGLPILKSGIPLLMEKPLTDEIQTTKELIAASTKYGVPLICGLLERFNPAVRTAFEIAKNPIYFKSIRHSPMTPRIQTGVAGDLLIHDVDLALRLFGGMPIKTFGMKDSEKNSIEDIAEGLLQFSDNRIASVSASRRSQRKVRSISIAEPNRLIEVDLLRQDVTIYQNVSESISDSEIGYKQLTAIDIPALRFQGEPLMMQLEHFADLIERKIDGVSELNSMLQAHEVIEMIKG
jgi:predicted dehydrogenase